MSAQHNVSTRAAFEKLNNATLYRHTPPVRTPLTRPEWPVISALAPAGRVATAALPQVV